MGSFGTLDGTTQGDFCAATAAEGGGKTQTTQMKHTPPRSAARGRAIWPPPGPPPPRIHHCLLATVVELNLEQFKLAKEKMLKAEIEDQYRLHQQNRRLMGGKKITFSGKKNGQLLDDLETLLTELYQ